MDVTIRQATSHDLDVVSGILLEAVHWLADTGKPMWREEEIVPARIASYANAGVLFIADCDGEVAGTMRFELQDPIVWPDVPHDDSTFVHRLAVRRKFAGGAVSSALLRWAVERTRSLGRRHLRLDCDATRPRLRAIYERFGFTHHSNIHIGPYFDARYEYDVTWPPMND